MNSHRTSPGNDSHDWQAQERALSAPQTRRDALLAKALQTLPVAQPPEDFAASMARLVAAAAPVQRQDDAVLERTLQRILFVVLALGGLVAVLVYGGSVWANTVATVGDTASQWLLAGLATVAVSSLPVVLRRLMDDPAPAAALTGSSA